MLGVTVSDKPSSPPNDASSMALVYQSDCIIPLSQVTNFPNTYIEAGMHAVISRTDQKNHVIHAFMQTLGTD